MRDPRAWALLVYGCGVAIGLARGDAGAAARVGLALTWPIGILSFVLTLAVLLAASAVAYPVVGVGVLLAAAVYSAVSR